MKIRPWLIRLLILLFFLMMAALAVVGYFLYQQHQRFSAISKLAVELRKQNDSLATQVHELKTMAELARRSSQVEQTTTPPTTVTTTTVTTTTAAKPTTTVTTAAAAGRTTETGEPAVSDAVSIRIVRQTITNSRISVVFDVVNKNQSAKPVTGYVTTIARGQRAGKPWIEASPAMRLSPLGRPLNYRRGEAFSVQRYRRFRANFQVADKKFKRLEFLLYSRSGDLMLVKLVDLTKSRPSVTPRRAPRGNEG